MINLLPSSERKLLRRIWKLRACITALAALIVAIVIGGLLFFPTLFLVNARYNVAEEQIRMLESKSTFFSEQDLVSLRTLAGDLEKKLVGETFLDPTQSVQKIQSVLPSTITLSRYAVSDTSQGTMQLFGIAKTRAALEAFVRTLEGLPEIESVESPISNYVKSTNASFTITLSVKKT